MTDIETHAELVAVPDPSVADDVTKGQAAYADVTADRGGELRPVIPESWQRGNVRATVRFAARRHVHKTAYHGLRSPKYLAVWLWHALRGAAVLSSRLFHLVLWTEGWMMESRAAAAGRAGHQHQMSAHTQGLKTRGQRLRITGVCLAAFAAGVAAMWHYAPHWSLAVPAVTLVAFLSHHGRQEGKRIVRPAVISPHLEKLTESVVVRALGSLGLSVINKHLADGGEINFIAPGVARDGPGARVVLDLPAGVTADDVIKERDKFAAALRRPLACVWPEGQQDEHPGRLVLYVCDESLNKARQPAWPLASAARASLFKPVPFGTDQRMRPVTVTLMYANLLIGAISRMGKTGAMRLVLLAAALDPLAELHVWELKGTGDLDPLERVAHSFGSGADDDTIAAAFADLRKVHEELERRAKKIKELDRNLTPQKKVTPELARRKSLGLHPIVYAIDECQEAFTSKWKADFEELCLQLIRRGPALGIMLWLATQRPDSKSLPTGITANIAQRFCLKVMDQTSNDMVLGTSAYKRGINATLFAFEDKGLGWAIGFAPEAKIIKGYEVDVPAADRIAQRARAAREAAGRLTGQAAGLAGDEVSRDVLGDVAAMFAGEAGLHWAVLAERLARRLPDTWADVTADAISQQCRDLGVPSVLVKMDGIPLRGCRLDDVRKAVEG